MIVTEPEVGLPPEGNVAHSWGSPENQEVFGIGDASCSCSPINYKNLSMLLLGGAVAILGPKTGSKRIDIVLRAAGAAIAVLGAGDILSYYAYGGDVKGLGSEWYRNDRTDKYLNRFASAIQSRFSENGLPTPRYNCETCEGLGSSCICCNIY